MSNIKSWVILHNNQIWADFTSRISEADLKEVTLKTEFNVLSHKNSNESKPDTVKAKSLKTMVPIYFTKEKYLNTSAGDGSMSERLPNCSACFTFLSYRGQHLPGGGDGQGTTTVGRKKINDKWFIINFNYRLKVWINE